MTVYSYKGAFPYPLPAKHLYGGSWVLTSELTDEQLLSEGFTAAPAPPDIDPNTGDKIDWDGSSWVVIPPSAADTAFKWAEIRTQRNKLLVESDFYIVRAYEESAVVSDSVKLYRQELRDITTQTNPYSIAWPILGV